MPDHQHPSRTGAATAALLLVLAAAHLHPGRAQQKGTNVREVHPPLPMTSCGSNGTCTTEATSVVLDQNWRWVHGTGGYSNCYTGTAPRFCGVAVVVVVVGGFPHA